jgi:hypothetical protein
MRSLTIVLTPLLLAALLHAQDAPHAPPTEAAPPAPAAEKPRDRPTKRLAFGPTPEGWRARPLVPGEKALARDYDLPPAEGDAEGARVNLMYYPHDLATVRERLSHRWKQADGSAFPLEAHELEKVGAAGVTLVTIGPGTYSPKTGAPREGFVLVAGHVDAEGGAWSAWLFGPAKTVEQHRSAYRAWLGGLRVVGLDGGSLDGKARDAEAEVRFVHGAPPHGTPGPWALCAWRIGVDALARLGAARERAWELDVVLRAPREVRYACMLDGLLAATGASPGKLGLRLEPVEGEAALQALVTHRPSGRTLTYTLPAAVRDAIREVDYADFPAAAAWLEARGPEELFECAETKVAPGK